MLRYAVNATPRGDNLLFLARKSVLWRVSTPSGWMEAKPWVGFASRGPHVHRLTAVPAARGSLGWGAGMAAYLAPADPPGSSTEAQRPTRYPLGVVAADTAPGTRPPPPNHAPAPCWQPPFVFFPRPRAPPRPVWSGPVALRGLSALPVWVLGSGSFISTNRLQTGFSIWS